MSKKLKNTFPHIGLRIIKSAIAVALCYLVSFIRGDSGIVFYSQLATLWCIQMYAVNTKKNAAQRIIGTGIGALYGLIFLLLKENAGVPEKYAGFTDAAVISFMIIVVLYTTVIIKKKQASYFSCVVFLSIAVNHAGDANPYLFVWNRFLDTIIGIVIGIGVNSFSLPRDRRRDILFISGLEDVLVDEKNVLSDFSRVELNRMLDDGANFTVSTVRTPASLMEPMRDIRLKLPVIAMDGAVLYDIRQKIYMRVYVISSVKSKEITGLFKELGLSAFINVVVDDMLVIYYDDTEDEVHRQLVSRLRTSPFRNYVKRPLPETENVVYFMLLYPGEVIENCYRILKERGITEELKIVRYAAQDYPGYSYLKIYNKNATKENMTQYLKKTLNIEKTVTFGSIPGQYDELIEDGDVNQMVRTLKRLYEPVKRPGFLKK